MIKKALINNQFIRTVLFAILPAVLILNPSDTVNATEADNAVVSEEFGHKLMVTILL